MKHFILYITYAIANGATHANDSRAEDGEDSVRVSAYSLGEAVETLRDDKRVTGIFGVEGARFGKFHKCKVRF
jgi:hypothetical protein